MGSENKVDFKVADSGDDVKGEETIRLTVCSLWLWKGWLRFLEMMVLKWQLIYAKNAKMKKGSSVVEQTVRAECGQRIVNVVEGLMHNPVKDGISALVNNR